MRREWENRPALIFAVSLVTGMATVYSVINALFLLLLFWYSRSRSSLIMCSLGVLTGLMLWPQPRPMITEDKPFSGMVDVLTVPRPAKNSDRVLVRSNDLTLMLIYPQNSDVSKGDRLMVTGVVRGFHEGMEQYWISQGASGFLMSRSMPMVISEGPLFWRMSLSVRRSFVSFIDSVVEPNRASVIDGLCFNQDKQMTAELKESLTRTGTVHIVSTSGMHVVTVAAFCAFLLGFLPVSRSVQIICLGLILLLYAGAAGMQAPVVRALTIAMLYQTAYIARRSFDAISALAVAAIGTLALAPHALLDVGFQLSFVAFGSLILFMSEQTKRPSNLRERLWNGSKLALRLSAVATIATAPLVAYHFGGVSLISVVANLLILVAVTLIVQGSLLIWLISFVFQTLAEILINIFIGPQAHYLILVVDTLSELPGAYLLTPSFSGYFLPVVYGCLLLLWRPIVRKA